MRFFAFALLLPLLAAPAHAAANIEPQEVELHFLPRPGDKLRQSMDMKMQMAINMLPGAATSDAERARLVESAKTLGHGISMDMGMTLRTEASEADAKGDYLLHLRGEGGSIHMRMGDGSVKDLPNPVGGMEIDALTNEKRTGADILRMKSNLPAFKDSKALNGVAEGILKQAFGAMSGLEGRRMKVGETAEIPFEMQMPMQQLPQNAHLKTSIAFTLKSIQHGVAHFDTAVKMSMEAGPSENAGKDMKIAMSGSGTGVMDYRIADRLPMRHDIDALMHMEFTTPTDVSMQMDMKMQMNSRGERYR